MKFQKFTIRILLVLLCGLFCQISYAQIILTGSLMDGTNQPIEYATVFVKNAETSEVVDGVISDGKGAYKLQLKEKGQYVLVVNFLGFADHNQTLDVNESMELEQIVMESSQNTLGVAVVTAKRAVIEKRDNKLVFNIEQSPLKEGFSGTEVLERSPNVIIDNTGNILMRNEQARVLINGKISNLSNEDLADYIGNLRSEEIQKIEIQSHLAANTDAEDAGGLINIILKKRPLGFDGSVRMDYTFKAGGDYNMNPGINLNYGTEKLNIYGAYNFRRFTQVSPVFYKNEFFQTNNWLKDAWDWTEKSDRNSVKVGIVYDPFSNQTLGFEYSARTNVFSFANEGVVNLYNNIESGTDNLLETGNVVFDGVTKVYLNNFSFNYSWEIDSVNSTLKFFADYSDEKVLADNFSQSEYEEQFYTDNTGRNNFDLGTKFYSAQVDLDKKLKNDFSVEVGSKWVFINRNSRVLSDELINDEWIPDPLNNSFNYEESIFGVYAMASKTINEKNFLQAGLRFENTQLNRIEPFDDFEIKRNYSKLFPSAYYSRDLGKSNSLSLSYARKMSRPPLNYLDNYILKLNDFSYEVGNPELLPEYTNKFELSFKQSKQSSSLYFNNTTDVMKSTHLLEGETTFFKIINRGVENIVGLEYNRFGNIKDWWFLKGTGGVSRVMFKGYEENDFINANTAYFSLANNFKIGENTSIDISADYSSPSYSGFCKMGSVFYADLMVQQNFFDNRLTFRVYLTDLFNQLRFRQKCDFGNYTTSIFHKEKSRTLRFWMSYNFSSKQKINKRTIESSKNEIRGL